MKFEQATQFIINKIQNELPAQFIYHDVDHTIDVRDAAQNIGRIDNITDDDMKLLLTAAAFHDSGFLIRALGHEEASCGLAREILPGYDYTAAEIDLICGMIMATRLPQTPTNHLEKILADADLDYLGRDDFFTIGHKLFQELSLANSIGNEVEWNQSQVAFMKKHRYFTQTAINLRRAKKIENIELIKAQLIS